MTLPCAVAADERIHQVELAESDRFQRQLEDIDDLINEASNAIYDSKLGRNATLKIIRLRLEEALDKVKEMEG